SQKLAVKLGLKLTQLVDVNLKNQIMTTNVWVTQEWYDNKLKWDPEEYGGVLQLYVPSEQIWLPDIVLYNNGDGNYEITIMTKAIIVNFPLKYQEVAIYVFFLSDRKHWNGRVEWNPPAIYKSTCNIDINYFPFDYQECTMKFGSWTYDGVKLDLIHLAEVNGTDLIEVGIDLSEFYLNVEWDIMKVPALRKVIKYTCCPQVYIDITYNITLRRKTLFYTINLIIPCVGISCLSILVFYLPSDSGEKVTLSISILLSLTFFFLVMIEIMPSTSLVIPLLGKYLIFTMVLVTLSVLIFFNLVIVTILVMNIHFRSPSTHRMSSWVRKVFIHTLPKWLLMKSPQFRLEPPEKSIEIQKRLIFILFEIIAGEKIVDYCLPTISFNNDGYPMNLKKNYQLSSSQCNLDHFDDSSDSYHNQISDEKYIPSSSYDHGPHFCYPRKIDEIIMNAIFIAHHIDNADEYKSNQEDWKYVSMVLDRLFLWIFTVACVIGTGGILMVAPSIYDPGNN
ncbi:acetylcholine receptor subunit alpha-like protein 1-like protein 2, partial [Sarcoptes scabiei]